MLDGVELYYEERGSGAPLLLIAGIPAVADDWAPLAKRLVLGCTHCGVAHSPRPPRETGRAFAMETDDWELRMRRLAPFAFADGVDPEFLREFVAKKSRDVQDPEGYRAQIAAALAHDTYERLERIDRPTLIVTGDHDRVIPAGSSEVLRERIPGSRLETVRGAGHLFFLERPEESVRLLEEFLAA
jgi:pimeloyl-ACP methyl ester carboxylesterase